MTDLLCPEGLRWIYSRTVRTRDDRGSERSCDEDCRTAETAYAIIVSNTSSVRCASLEQSAVKPDYPTSKLNPAINDSSQPVDLRSDMGQQP